MAQYQTTPFKAMPKLLIQGTPEYVYGSLNDKTSATLGFVISDSAVTTTGTLTFQIVSGNIPIPGALITVVGTTNASGNFNVTNATLLTVTTTVTGVCTVTYAITSSTVAVGTGDAGQVSIPQIEIGDNLTAALVAAVPYSSVPVAAVVGATVTGRSTSATVTFPVNSAAFPSTLSAVNVVIQGSNIDRDDHYNTVGTILSGAVVLGTTYDWQSGQGDTATGTLAAGSVDLLSFRFYRLQIITATGAGYVVGTIMQ